MLLGRVVGEVWATAKDSKVENMTFLLVRGMRPDRSLDGGYVVAVDAVGAGLGEIVLVAQGSSARQSELAQGRPVDAVIMAILDDVRAEDRDWASFDESGAEL